MTLFIVELANNHTDRQFQCVLWLQRLNVRSGFLCHNCDILLCFLEKTGKVCVSPCLHHSFGLRLAWHMTYGVVTSLELTRGLIKVNIFSWQALWSCFKFGLWHSFNTISKLWRNVFYNRFALLVYVRELIRMLKPSFWTGLNF